MLRPKVTYGRNDQDREYQGQLFADNPLRLSTEPKNQHDIIKGATVCDFKSKPTDAA